MSVLTRTKSRCSGTSARLSPANYASTPCFEADDEQLCIFVHSLYATHHEPTTHTQRQRHQGRQKDNCLSTFFFFFCARRAPDETNGRAHRDAQCPTRSSVRDPGGESKPIVKRASAGGARAAQGHVLLTDLFFFFIPPPPCFKLQKKRKQSLGFLFCMIMVILANLSVLFLFRTLGAV